jgi:hypothetical protein
MITPLQYLLIIHAPKHNQFKNGLTPSTPKAYLWASVLGAGAIVAGLRAVQAVARGITTLLLRTELASGEGGRTRVRSASWSPIALAAGAVLLVFAPTRLGLLRQ